jgi:hypothetical protein
MANRAVADDGFAFDDLSDHSDFIVRQQHAHAFADRSGVAADRDKVTVAVRADYDVTSETQDAFCT